MTSPQLKFESWSRTGPSYAPTYFICTAVMASICSLVYYKSPLTPLGVALFVGWGAVCAYWLIKNSRAERIYSIDRIVIQDGKLMHSLHFAITESEPSTVNLNEIVQVRVYSGSETVVEIEFTGGSEVIVLASKHEVNKLLEAVQEVNPQVTIVRP